MNILIYKDENFISYIKEDYNSIEYFMKCLNIAINKKEVERIKFYVKYIKYKAQEIEDKLNINE